MRYILEKRNPNPLKIEGEGVKKGSSFFSKIFLSKLTEKPAPAEHFSLPLHSMFQQKCFSGQGEGFLSAVLRKNVADLC